MGCERAKKRFNSSSVFGLRQKRVKGCVARGKRRGRGSGGVGDVFLNP